MYRLTYFLLVVCCCSCGNEGTPPPPTSDTEVAGPGLSSEAGDANAQRSFAQQRVDRVDRMYLEGRLRCDTIRYDCAGQERGGVFTRCYLGDDLVKADHLATPPQPTLVYTEVYYLEDGEVYFAALASDPPTEQGSSLPTLETRYYYEGKLIEQTGPELRGALGPQTVLQVGKQGSYSCD